MAKKAFDYNAICIQIVIGISKKDETKTYLISK